MKLVGRFRCILLLSFLFISSSVFANAQFSFLQDWIMIFSNLDNATNEFNKVLDKPGDIESVKKASMEYVSVLMKSQNELLVYTSNEDEMIKTTSTDLRNLMVDVVKENYDFMLSLRSETSLSKVSKEFKEKLKFVTGFFREISLGVCMAITNKNEVENREKNQSLLTKTQYTESKKLFISAFGRSVKRGLESSSKNAFEEAAKMVYSFIALESVPL